jgi:hypothetical protein
VKGDDPSVTRQQRVRRRLPLRLTSLAVALSIGILLVGSEGMANARVRAPKRGAWFGAYANPKSGQSSYTAVRAFERLIGRKSRVVNKYHSFSDHNYDFERQAARSGHIPLISWRATDASPDGTRAQKIARGDYDGVIRAAADGMRRIKGRVLLRFNWEMDQDPGQRQYIGPPSDFIAAWRHVVSIFRSQHAHNVMFVWAPRAGSFRSGQGQRYWPGARWVDWIGGSAVPTDNWNSFSTLYGAYYRWAHKRSKPLLIWAGVRENPSAPMWKAGFFDDAGRILRRRWHKVKAFVYYHALSPLGYQFWVDTSGNSLSAYRQMGRMRWFHPARFRH